MATKLDADPRRISILVQVVIDYFDGHEIPELKQRLSTELGTITSSEMAYAVQVLADSKQAIGNDTFVEEHELLMHELLDSILTSDSTEGTPPGHPVNTFMKENRAIAALVGEIRSRVAEHESSENADWLSKALSRLWQIDIHYTRKELQLFPFLEKAGFDRPSTVMWSVHDDIRSKIKEQRQHLAQDQSSLSRDGIVDVLNAVDDMIHKEETVLYPTSLQLLNDSTWGDIRRGESEIGYCLIDPPVPWEPTSLVPREDGREPQQAAARHSLELRPARPTRVSEDIQNARIGTIELGNGALTPDELNLLLKHVPLDITYVDEFDEVRFYNRGTERVFPRSPGIIGREVRYCHPPKSVHIVLEIVSEFKSGNRDIAEFWLQMGGAFLHIRYFALRDDDGAYKGVIEVSQDITHLRADLSTQDTS